MVCTLLGGVADPQLLLGFVEIKTISALEYKRLQRTGSVSDLRVMSAMMACSATVESGSAAKRLCFWPADLARARYLSGKTSEGYLPWNYVIDIDWKMISDGSGYSAEPFDSEYNSDMFF